MFKQEVEAVSEKYRNMDRMYSTSGRENLCFVDAIAVLLKLQGCT